MDIQYFPHFIRKNYAAWADSVSTEDIIELGTEFKKYLEDKFKDNLKSLEPIWDITPATIIMNTIKRNPFTVNGYHSVFVLHFSYFIEKSAKKYEQEQLKNNDGK